MSNNIHTYSSSLSDSAIEDIRYLERTFDTPPRRLSNIQSISAFSSQPLPGTSPLPSYPLLASSSNSDNPLQPTSTMSNSLDFSKFKEFTGESKEESLTKWLLKLRLSIQDTLDTPIILPSIIVKAILFLTTSKAGSFIDNTPRLLDICSNYHTATQEQLQELIDALTRRFPPSNQESFIDPSTKIKNIKQEVDEDYEKYFNRIIDILKEIGIEDVEPSLQTNIPSRILLNTAIKAFINSIRDKEI